MRDIAEFCRRMEEGGEPWEETEELGNEERFRETVVMGLRMTDGVLALELRKRFGIDIFAYYDRLLAGLVQQGLVSSRGQRVRLTPAGMMVADRVMAELV